MPLPMTVRRTIARNLQASRNARGFSRCQIADGLGLSVETLAEIERGAYLPSAAELQLMCRWYRVPIEGIFRSAPDADANVK